jgi:hypothetical protein
MTALDPKIAARAADEGIPVAALARIFQIPYQDIVDVLKDAMGRGELTEIPKSDWPPGSRRIERVPVNAAHMSDEDIQFLSKRHFKLTLLEAEFMCALLRNEREQKAKLHAIIEHLRNARRANQPDGREATDPKMVDVVICKLRKKLKGVDERFLITTIWSDGYYLRPDTKKALYDHLGGLDATAAKEVTGAS